MTTPTAEPTGDTAAAGGGEPPRLLTVGHGTTAADGFAALLRSAGVEAVVDVRRYPGSRRNPQFNRGQLERWLPAHGIAYRWEERLGGRRRRSPESPHTGLRDPSFRAYGDHLGTEAFRSAIDEVLRETGQRRVAVLCSESVWWRCHRRLIADHVTLLTDVVVGHLMPDGRITAHQPTDVVRVADGRLLYDGGAPSLDLTGGAGQRRR
jgi:uncharacterized protein (DUF488 family)